MREQFDRKHRSVSVKHTMSVSFADLQPKSKMSLAYGTDPAVSVKIRGSWS